MSEDRDPLEGLDPALIRGMTMPRVNRRKFLQVSGAVAGAAGLSAFLAACGVKGVGSAANQNVDWTKYWANAKKTTSFNFANWPIYIDRVPGGYPSLDYFKKTTGITVNYKPVINDNPSFFATIRPPLEQGQDTGWDLMVMSSGTPEVDALVRNGWLTPLDQNAMTNFNKYASAQVKNPWYDPGNKYMTAYQSGFTGIGINTKYLPSNIKVESWADLWNPALKGHVGMFADYEELGSAALLKMGVQPADSTPTQWRAAAQELTQQRDAGIVRAYYEQGYINHLQNGDVWVCQAWSGDVLTSQLSGYPELQYIVPSEGQMFWTDCMMIPLKASNPRAAMTYMDYVYDPYVAAMMADWIWYTTPVPSSQQVIEEYAKQGKTFYEGLAPNMAVAKSNAVYPSQTYYNAAKQYYKYKSPQDEQLWISIFEPIYQS
jgi:spermidine/putrescine transport system substrate-binding protein